jgi:CubicO group peptidase (beta-lactamase class C family)
MSKKARIEEGDGKMTPSNASHSIAQPQYSVPAVDSPSKHHPAGIMAQTWQGCQSFCLMLPLLLGASLVQAASEYFPGPQWQARAPATQGFDAGRLTQAINLAKQHETQLPAELAAYVDVKDLARVRSMYQFTNEPFDEVIGPMAPRGAFTGMVIKNGYIVAEWGDVERVDMTHSISKTFLSSVAGLAYDAGLIRDLDDTVAPYLPAPVAAEYFSQARNSQITWDHLLRQTSFWRGTLWGKPDWADRPGKTPWAEFARETPAPGSIWKYNDVRVNALALALLHVWREPLPGVLKTRLMDPIGASSTWRWHGYENSWVEIDGQEMQSVSGGGHWGGGMFISARDLGRLGLLALHRGRWQGQQILSADWVALSRTPTAANTRYGFMNYFLNTDQQTLPDLPANSYFFAGAGSNIVYVDEDQNLVVVLRWIDRKSLNLVLKAIRGALVEG